MTYARYGIYFTPGPGEFANAGASWLGWDIAQGAPLDSPEPALTARPRKYGFHATIKPPFSLARGQTPEALSAGLADICANCRPVRLSGLGISMIGSFFAFTATGEHTTLSSLASRTVRELDVYRAPPSEDEIARRRQSRLTPQQEDNLQRWGYPYVMQSFRFHMSLTGPVPREERRSLEKRIRQHFSACQLVPFEIDSLTLVGEDHTGYFHKVERFLLAGE